MAGCPQRNNSLSLRGRFVHANKGKPNASSDTDFNDGPSTVPSTWTALSVPWSVLTRTWISMSRILSPINTCHLACKSTKVFAKRQWSEGSCGFAKCHQGFWMTAASKHREVGWPREPGNLENHKGTSHWDKVPYNKSRNMKRNA